MLHIKSIRLTLQEDLSRVSCVLCPVRKGLLKQVSRRRGLEELSLDWLRGPEDICSNYEAGQFLGKATQTLKVGL